MVDHAEMIGRLFSSFFWQIQNVYSNLPTDAYRRLFQRHYGHAFLRKSNAKTNNAYL